MKPAQFEFHRPATLAEALALLGGEDAKALAGGQSLIPMMNFRVAQPATLVDLSGITELTGIRQDGDDLVIGAMCRHNTVKGDPLVAAHAPLVPMAYEHVAHFTIRNRGTLGGNLCHCDPASEMPMVMRVLGAEMEIASVSGHRRVAADDFFFGPFTTAIEANELLAAIRLPPSPEGRKYAFQEVSLRKGDFAMAAVAAAIDLDERGHVLRARIGMCGVSDIPLRAGAAETSLAGVLLTAGAAADAAEAAIAEVEFTGTAAVSAAYRRDLTRTLISRTLLDCAKEAE